MGGPAGRGYDRRVLVASVVLQLAAGLLLGHSYDTRVFLATGYLVGHGHDPYVARDLAAVFHQVGFAASATIGYPPPWPLALGLIERAVAAVTPSLLVYGLAIKLPVIAADIGLAYLVAAILRGRGRALAARRAWTFLLLNPLLLFVGAAWGEIDPIVAALALAALWLLERRRADASALLLALAVCVKPIALPLLPAALVWLAYGGGVAQGGSAGLSRPGARPALAPGLGRAARYLALFLGGVLLLYVAPFYAFGWSRAPFTQSLNAQFVSRGGLSFMTVVRLFRDPLLMQGRWWLLGLLWMPALALGTAALRRGDGGLEDLLRKGSALALVVLLTRAWVAEPNTVLLLPFLTVLVGLGALDRRALRAAWALPLAFAVLNAAPLQLLWVSWPGLMARLLADVGRYGQATLVARAVVVVAWQATGWWVVWCCLRRTRSAVAPAPSATEAAA